MLKAKTKPISKGRGRGKPGPKRGYNRRGRGRRSTIIRRPSTRSIKKKEPSVEDSFVSSEAIPSDSENNEKVSSESEQQENEEEPPKSSVEESPEIIIEDTSPK